MPVKHKAQALAITCIDFRFQEMIDQDLKNRGLNGSVDRISLPGASIDLAKVKETAQVSIGLHDPDLALIYEHEDCGAYQDDNSRQIHRANAQKLTAALKVIKPNLNAIALMATLEGIQEL